MVVLRLRRGGRRHDPHYRLVAQEKRSKLNGDYIENLGHYHPTVKGAELVVNKERTEYWLSQGAQLSTTVNNLLVQAGILPKERKISRVYSPKKKEATESAPAKEAAVAEAAVETTPEETETEPASEPAESESAPTETEETTPEEKTEEAPAAPESAE